MSAQSDPAAIHGTFHAAVNQYAPDRYNLLVRQECIELTGPEQVLEIVGSKWRISYQSNPGPGGGRSVEVIFKCERGGLSAASVAVELDVADWSVGNYVLMPSAVYAGNRFPSRRIPYSPKLCLMEDIGPDKPIIVTDIPKLNEGAGPSRIQERSGSMAFPSVGFRSALSGKGMWMLTEQGNSLGDYGIGIEETRDRGKATISITSPLVRESYSCRMCDMRHPSVDEPRDFAAGDEIRISLRFHVFEAPAVQSLFDKYAEIRKPKATPRLDMLPFSACFELQEQKFNRDNFVLEHGYYSVGLRQNFLQDWQIGWTGGMISTYPLLFAGDETTRRNVLRNFDWLFANGISPSGFFWDSGANGTEWFGGDIRKPHTANWHLIRKSADAVFFIIKQFLLMEKLGIEVKPVWQQGTRRVCDALLSLWRKNRQFGQFVDSLTGEIRVGGSTSAAIAPAALSLAARYFGNPAYLEIAVESAEHFYQNFTMVGLSCGGPGDALQNPDSESWYALIESYVALHDATGDRKWIERAGEASRQFSTWVVSYDYQFPAGSMFAKAGIRTTGSVYANTQNKHSAPGICTLSGLGLLKLFRATGDRFHLDLLHDIAHGLPQYLPHPTKPLGDATIGHMCERVNMTDWEGPERIGETLRMTTWAETSLMLTTIEIPGVYVQPDRSLVVAFDHVTAEIVTEDAAKLVVRIFNPTSLPAKVRILSECESESLRPLPENALFDGMVLSLSPRQGARPGIQQAATMTYILDMVHHNPGEPPFESAFLDPAHLVDYGFNGQVFKHINCIATYAATGVDCFPEGSAERLWLDGFTPGIVREIAAAKSAGLKVFYHIDLFVMPKRLAEHFDDEIRDPVSGRILLDRPMTLELHRVLFDELCARFPEVDGYIIRVGETYLMDTPFHVGNGPIPRVGPSWTPEYLYEEMLAGREPTDARWTPAQVEAYVSLIGFLRDELCVKHGKQVFFRTWDIFPDKLHARLDHYLEVTDRIEPHPNLAFSIKHTALDFWRHVKFNECLTRGKHPQIIEVQCQREYEGKGAYPNYVMDGVINGFEENSVRRGLRDVLDHPLVLGVYGWSRGGGWYGPYIPHELWPDLNAYVLARFVSDPSRTEEEIFREYAVGKLGLSESDAVNFRRLCLLSARGILKGRHCEAFDRELNEAVLPTACWMRDDRLGGEEQLLMVLDFLSKTGRLDEVLAEKAEAVSIWQEISDLSDAIDWPPGAVGDYAKISARYGRILFGIVHQGWRVLIAGRRGADDGEIRDAISCYERGWRDFHLLGKSADCASLYRGEYFSLPGAPAAPGLDESVLRHKNPPVLGCSPSPIVS